MNLYHPSIIHIGFFLPSGTQSRQIAHDRILVQQRSKPCPGTGLLHA